MHPVHRFAKNRPRLSGSVAVGILAAFSIPAQWQQVTRALVAWNIAVWLYLILAGWLMAHASHAKVRQIAAQEERSAVAVLAIMSFAAILSIVAIVLELATSAKLSPDLRFAHYAFTGLTVLGSWCLVAVIFTFHYAYLFYAAPATQRPLKFPNDEKEPNYWDFLYFSFTIAVAAQTSDVSIMTRPMRKSVLAQSVLSFFFNAAILGFSINIAAGVVGT